MLSTSPFLGELLGTLTLILLGNGVVANCLLAETKGYHEGLIVIATGWAFAVTVGIFVAIAFGSADAHLNPAVTLALAVARNDFSKLATYLPAQFLGAFAGATLVWIQYLPHWGKTTDQAAQLACFATAPAIRQPAANFLAEVIPTVVLVCGAGAIGSKAVGTLATGLGPFLVGALVWGIGLSLGGPTGYAINPARDLAPRLAHALLPIRGKGTSDWGYAWVPVLAPMAGGVLGGLVLRAFGL